MQILSALATILPTTGAPGTPATLAQTGLTFFGTWISRIGGLVAFIGAIKFALSIKSDDSREQIPRIAHDGFRLYDSGCNHKSRNL